MFSEPFSSSCNHRTLILKFLTFGMHLGQVEAELIYESHQLTKQRRSIKKYIYGLMAFVLGGSLIAYRYQKVDRPLVILVSLDGTRPEYLQRGLTPNLNKIGSGGYMSDMIPVFPSITFPNHYSLATGLFPESHGYFALI